MTLHDFIVFGSSIWVRRLAFDEFDLTLHDFDEFDLTLHNFNEFDLTLHDFDEFDTTLEAKELAKLIFDGVR